MLSKSPLDEALEAARNDPSQANFFYDSFLNCDIFTPVLLAGKTEGTWKQLGVKEPFQPLYSTEGDTKVLPVFDSIERLKNWSQPRHFDFVAIRTHLLLKILAKNVAINLNPGLEFHFYFPPDILELLRNAMHPIKLN